MPVSILPPRDESPAPKRPGDGALTHRSAYHACASMFDVRPVRRESSSKKRPCQGGAGDDDCIPAGDGHEERDPRAVGAGWLRTYSRIAAAGWASGGFGRVKQEGE